MQVGNGYKSPLPQFAVVRLAQAFHRLTAAVADANDLSSPPSTIPDPAYKRLPTGLGATPGAFFSQPLCCSCRKMLFCLPLRFSDKKKHPWHNLLGI